MSIFNIQQRFSRCFCCRQQSRRCLIGQTISWFCWPCSPQRWQFGEHLCFHWPVLCRSFLSPLLHWHSYI